MYKNEASRKFRYEAKKAVLKETAAAAEENRGIGKRKKTRNVIVNPSDHEAAMHRPSR